MQKNKDSKTENKLFFTFPNSMSKLQASPHGTISMDKNMLDGAALLGGLTLLEQLHTAEHVHTNNLR